MGVWGLILDELMRPPSREQIVRRALEEDRNRQRFRFHVSLSLWIVTALILSAWIICN